MSEPVSSAAASDTGDDRDQISLEDEAKEQTAEAWEDELEENDKKRVKWDRGLCTAMFVDEVKPRPQKPKENIVMRGCLAPKAKV